MHGCAVGGAVVLSIWAGASGAHADPSDDHVAQGHSAEHRNDESAHQQHAQGAAGDTPSNAGTHDPSLDEPQPASNADFSGNGANEHGAYDSTRDGSPSENGNGNGAAVGKPCAGCVGKADNKNPAGQFPDGTDANNGYECDGNSGVGKTNPAHTGCVTAAGNPPATPVVKTPVASVLGVSLTAPNPASVRSAEAVVPAPATAPLVALAATGSRSSIVRLAPAGFALVIVGGVIWWPTRRRASVPLMA
jgi:hypothetical protein